MADARRAQLREHITSLLAFYNPIVRDPSGGFYNQLTDTGEVYDADTKHVVGTCRFTVNYALASRVMADDTVAKQHSLDMLDHGLEFLMSQHWDTPHGGFSWVLSRKQESGSSGFVVEDGAKWGYSVAFGLLAVASAKLAGVAHVDEPLARVLDLVAIFKDGSTGLYVDSFDRELTTRNTYRGQNSNMHMCEALIAAYEATRNVAYLEDACRVAQMLTVQLSGGCKWVIEHYDESWVPDPEKNKDADPKSEEYIFRPPGYQPGHSMEWAKLLVLLDRHSGALDGSKLNEGGWMLETAKTLFTEAVKYGWAENGGLVYLVEKSADGETKVRDGNKYYWALAEMIGASGLLAARCAAANGDDTEDSKFFWEWYDKAWVYANEHFVDTERGGWYPMVNAANVRVDEHAKEGHIGAPVKCYPSKTDYHPLAACFEVLRALGGVVE
jgi:mannose/cellobiose epimerase-like protein (N-acyl-D-glucosamine 2-epimerase family)